MKACKDLTLDMWALTDLFGVCLAAVTLEDGELSVEGLSCYDVFD